MSAAFEAEHSSVNEALDGICGRYLGSLPPAVADAATYGLKGPGKRLRPLLVILAYRACGGRADPTLLACSIEVLHCYSLIHDDLPCMDDDDMRRGRPTVHRVHGSSAAMLAGVALIPIAFIVVGEACRQLKLEKDIDGRIRRSLARAAGPTGMIGGQLSDLLGEGVSLSLEERERMHSAKTGALIRASLEIGGIAAGATEPQMSGLGEFGRTIGLAFQIMDDVLDVTSSSKTLGKTAGRDEALGKSTYPALLGIDGARDRAEALITRGSEALKECGLLTPELSQVANFMVNRQS
ncbi:MAG TPA: farnesyl diphosphate synthase [Gemmatimonadaceae bacterium]|nr:farnesyl diphosphate synthase [Gemmatimonadaceae bacterium]